MQSDRYAVGDGWVKSMIELKAAKAEPMAMSIFLADEERTYILASR